MKSAVLGVTRGCESVSSPQYQSGSGPYPNLHMTLLAHFLAAVVLAASFGLPVTAQEVGSLADAEMEALLQVIENDAARERLVDQLRRLAEDGPHAETTPHGGMLAATAAVIQSTAAQMAEAVTVLGEPGVISEWFREQLVDGNAPNFWRQLVLALVSALAAGLAAEWLTARATRVPLDSVQHHSVSGWTARAVMAAAHLVLLAIPVAVFAGMAWVALAMLAPSEPARLVVIMVIGAIAASRLGVAGTRVTLAPLAPGLRPLPLSDSEAAALFTWARRLIWYGVYAYFFAETARLLSVPVGMHQLLVKALGLGFAVLLVALVVQSRRTVADRISGRKSAAETSSATLRMLRERVAGLWHVLALAYITGGWVVWALEIADGPNILVEKTGATLLVLAAAWLAVKVVSWLTGISLGAVAEIGSRYSFVSERVERVLPAVRRAAGLVVQGVAVLAVLQVWGLDVLAWFTTGIGRELLLSGVTIALVVALSVVAWESASIAVRIYLERPDEDGGEVARSQRVRTLLPLARNALAVAISVMAGLVVLAELGVSIGPLLAGAGVAGLAVGFGAQTLVKDFITGGFILMEDSIKVGDVVRAGGRAGVVEALTVRALRLRDLSGTVYVVPFSTVDIVENMTKDFSYAVVDLGVAYREDYDHVVSVLEEVAVDLRTDDSHGPSILEPLQVLGLNELADSAVMIKMRLKTVPLAQWGVKREFLRRIKRRFDEEGIDIPFPHRTLYFSTDKEGTAASLVQDDSKDPDRT